MKIGIDISQLAYSGTGVAQYLSKLVEQLLKLDRENQYVLFYSSLRKNLDPRYDGLFRQFSHVTIKKFKFPPLLLDFMWNRLHRVPIEFFIGDVDIFISSDWTQPPTRKAKKITILYDLIVYKFPEETHKKIVAVQRRRIRWVKKECDKILCISESTKKDAFDILGIEKNRLTVSYPGV